MFYGVAGAPGVGADAVVFLGHRVLGGGAAQGGVQLAGGEVVEVEACLAVELLAGVLAGLHAGGNGARGGQPAQSRFLASQCSGSQSPANIDCRSFPNR